MLCSQHRTRRRRCPASVRTLRVLLSFFVNLESDAPAKSRLCVSPNKRAPIKQLPWVASSAPAILELKLLPQPTTSFFTHTRRTSTDLLIRLASPTTTTARPQSSAPASNTLLAQSEPPLPTHSRVSFSRRPSRVLTERNSFRHGGIKSAVEEADRPARVPHRLLPAKTDKKNHRTPREGPREVRETAMARDESNRETSGLALYRKKGICNPPPAPRSPPPSRSATGTLVPAPRFAAGCARLSSGERRQHIWGKARHTPLGEAAALCIVCPRGRLILQCVVRKSHSLEILGGLRMGERARRRRRLRAAQIHEIAQHGGFPGCHDGGGPRSSYSGRTHGPANTSTGPASRTYIRSSIFPPPPRICSLRGTNTRTGSITRHDSFHHCSECTAYPLSARFIGARAAFASTKRGYRARRVTTSSRRQREQRRRRNRLRSKGDRRTHALHSRPLAAHNQPPTAKRWGGNYQVPRSHEVQVRFGRVRGLADPCRLLLSVLLRGGLNRKKHHHA